MVESITLHRVYRLSFFCDRDCVVKTALIFKHSASFTGLSNNRRIEISLRTHIFSCLNLIDTHKRNLAAFLILNVDLRRQGSRVVDFQILRALFAKDHRAEVDLWVFDSNQSLLARAYQRYLNFSSLTEDRKHCIYILI